MRQLITEGLVIAGFGAAVGLALAYGGIRAFQQFQYSNDSGVQFSFELDGRALIVGLAVAATSALLSTVIPAWRSTRPRDLSNTLRDTTNPSARTMRLWGRHGLVAAQIAVTLVLLTVALTFYRAFEAEYSRGPGFRTDHLLLATLDPSLARYDPRQSDAFYQQLKERVTAIPNVTVVALTSFVPLSPDGAARMSIVPEGVLLPAGTDTVTTDTASVDEGYFDAFGIPIVMGRAVRATDTADRQRIAVISRGFASRYWPGENPIGRRIRLAGPDDAWVEVVGVAADVKFRLFMPVSTPFLYVPWRQNPSTRTTVVVRTETPSTTAVDALRVAILEIDRAVPIVSMRSVEDFYHANAKNLNIIVVRTIAGMGAMGLLLALVGLYGLTTYAVSRRTREIAIRMAVGALPTSILRMILRQGSVPTVVGIVLGVVISAAVGGVIQGVFPGTGTDVVTFVLILPIVIVVVMLAAYMPARRAAAIDPLAALRHN